jgi:hypothetical protein
MTARSTAIDHPSRRLVVALPITYDAARAHYETLVPEADMPRHDPSAARLCNSRLATSE